MTSRQKIQAVRGMNDILPSESSDWLYLEAVLRQLAKRYAYQEIRLPVVESTQLFKRTIGEVTDIVEKEMYTFADRNGDSLTLRPEGTAGCVRAVIEHSLLQKQPQQRLWYCGPMFRHERPQKGRYRQFYQFGLEAFGMAGPDIEAEQIAFTHRLWQQLGLSSEVSLQINCLGDSASRAAYREILIDYWQQHAAQLDEDSLKRLQSNPLRILDSKNPNLQQLIATAPKLIDYIDQASQDHFVKLQQWLRSLQIPFTINPSLVRGLDYYGGTVYEWVTQQLGAQGTLCAGGRYDSLVRELGGPESKAVGFAMGLERIVLMLQQRANHQPLRPDFFIVAVGDGEIATHAMLLGEQLRSASSELVVQINASGGNFKTQFKRADRSGARWALIIGEEEWQQQQLSIKNLRDDQLPQQTIALKTTHHQFNVNGILQLTYPDLVTTSITNPLS